MKIFIRHIATVGLAAACYGQPVPPVLPLTPISQQAESDQMLFRAKETASRMRDVDIDLAQDLARVLGQETGQIGLGRLDLADIDERTQMAMENAKAAMLFELVAPRPPRPAVPPMPPVSMEALAEQDEMISRAKEAASRFGGIDMDLRNMNLGDIEGRVQMVMNKANAAVLFAQAPQPMPKPAIAPIPPEPPSVWPGMKSGRQDSEERLYRRGAEYLDRREWEKAIDEFDKVIERKGAKADGAYYWKAYGLSKLGRRDLALASLAELKKSYSASRWLNDAKALEAEVQQAGGQGISPESQSDEDLKLFAINSLMNSDPERALPLLEKILQKNSSPKLKERALFVLAQNRSSKSNEIVSQFARGGGNPDLQQKAVEYLGIYGGKENLQTLGDIYGSSNDAGLKRGILRSFMVAHDKERLLSAAKSEQNADLRRDAIQYLGNLNAYAELSQLYTTEHSVEVKDAIIQALANGNNAERLIEIARTEKDTKLRLSAIHRLGNMSRSKTSDALVSIYSSEPDRNVKEQIIRSLFVQGSAKEIVEIARKETDPALKRSGVQALSRMNSKEATDFMMELLSK